MSEKKAKQERKAAAAGTGAHLSLTEKQRWALERDFLVEFVPLLPPELQSMQQALGVLINDIIYIGDKFGGSFPKALGEAVPEEEPKKPTILGANGFPVEDEEDDDGTA